MIGKRLSSRVAPRDPARLDIGERADHDVAAVVAQQLGRHRLELAAVEQVEEEGLEDVVAVMAERDLGRAQLAGHADRCTPRRRREHSPHIVLPSGITRFTTL